MEKRRIDGQRDPEPKRIPAAIDFPASGLERVDQHDLKGSQRVIALQDFIA